MGKLSAASHVQNTSRQREARTHERTQRERENPQLLTRSSPALSFESQQCTVDRDDDVVPKSCQPNLDRWIQTPIGFGAVQCTPSCTYSTSLPRCYSPHSSLLRPAHRVWLLVCRLAHAHIRCLTDPGCVSSVGWWCSSPVLGYWGLSAHGEIW
jgi:hypothetical protein